MNYPRVIRVSPAENHMLELEFDNGETGHLDMKPYLDFGIFQRLHDPQAFAHVKVAFDTVEWACGPDLDPEFVYSKCQKIVLT